MIPHGMELGTNGIVLMDADGRLVMCNHGLRAVTRLNANLHPHCIGWRARWEKVE